MKQFGYHEEKLKEVTKSYLSYLKDNFADNEFSRMELKQLQWHKPFIIASQLVHNILKKYIVRFSENPTLSTEAYAKTLYKNYKYARPHFIGGFSANKKYEKELVEEHIRLPHIEVYCLKKIQDNWSLKKKQELDYARPFDMHKESNDPKVDAVVDILLEQILKIPSKDINVLKKDKDLKTVKQLMVDLKKSKPDILHKHLKVVILDLVSLWLENPDKNQKNISVSRGSKSYSKNSVYNPNEISIKLLTVLDALWVLDYVKYDRGIRNIDDSKDGWSFTRKSRYRPTRKFLTNVIRVSGIDKAYILSSRIKPNLIFRERKYDEYLGQSVNTDVEYKATDDSDIIIKQLCAYNNLLRNTFIDIPDFPRSGLKTRNPDKNIIINFEDENHKFVQRIFNDGSWNVGGRFHGGWWQKLSSEWRQQIRIDGKPVIEYDYSGMHVVLLYALEGIDYWKSINKDPYDLSDYGYVMDEQMRNFLKVVLQVCVNLENKIPNASKQNISKAIKAIQFEINSNYDYYSWTKDYIDVENLVIDFCDYHKPIAKYFTRGKKEIPLHQLDSHISDVVITACTKKGIPVLCNHDSFIVPWDADDLDKDVQKGFQTFVLNHFSKTKSSKLLKVIPKLKEQTGVDWFVDSSFREKLLKKSKNKISLSLEIPAIEDNKYKVREKKFNKKISGSKYNSSWYVPSLGCYDSKPKKKKLLPVIKGNIFRLKNPHAKQTISTETKVVKNKNITKKLKLKMIRDAFTEKRKALAKVSAYKIEHPSSQVKKSITPKQLRGVSGVINADSNKMVEQFKLFKEAILIRYKNNSFSTKDARNIAHKLGFGNRHTHHDKHDDFHFIWWRVLYPHLKVSSGKYAFPKHHSFKFANKKNSSAPKKIKKVTGGKTTTSISYEELFKKEIIKRYGNKVFTANQANAMSAELGFSKSGKDEKIYTKCLYPNRVSKGRYAFPKNHSFKSLTKTKTGTTKRIKKVVKKTSNSNKKVVKNVTTKKIDGKVFTFKHRAVDMSSPIRKKYKKEIDRLYGNKVFTWVQARDAVLSSGLKITQWQGISGMLMKYFATTLQPKKRNEK